MKSSYHFKANLLYKSANAADEVKTISDQHYTQLIFPFKFGWLNIKIKSHGKPRSPDWNGALNESGA